ncbi:hypothetical protein AVEN_87953-1 [Araneus ventricosus]|uniref:Uncharacterized protein n=1 Tax=Araneus ventricosus TaxID=182803 RepID=A0A4Y2NGX3_ARAVE|nr:hypothetical protein AVEN_87953-1 [Araneus ventricosus]
MNSRWLSRATGYLRFKTGAWLKLSFNAQAERYACTLSKPSVFWDGSRDPKQWSDDKDGTCSDILSPNFPTTPEAGCLTPDPRFKVIQATYTNDPWWNRKSYCPKPRPYHGLIN